ncbi:hypothetical protein QBC34DRAFT_444296 [Podospora aff. communis PSN243]|uniref:AMP-dependent synthetase/ligase domain-containing protein n=1 Tax=Podospora aff. communis PSN243 TaxID=3040156 RepID=A0AAV9G244_9PEZI|nr:hypothetical protein QBC34DRAFT_444296 [Podospora aff. communis PSN243]
MDAPSQELNGPLPALSESFGEEIDDHLATLWDIWTASATKSPDAEALVSMWQTESSAWEITPITPEDTTPPPYLRWSYRDIYTRASALASTLSSRGVKPGDRIAVFLWNSAEYPLFLWAAAKLGAVFCPLDPRVITTDGTALLAATSPTVIVVQDEAGAASLPSLPSPPFLIQCSGPPTPTFTPLSSLLSPTPPLNPIPASSPVPHSALALIIFTSGTTSAPKGCPHTHSHLLAQTHQYDANLDPSFVDRWLVHTPSSHIFAVNHMIRAWRLADAVILPAKTFSVQATLDGLAKEGGTIMSAVPTLVKALLGHPDFPGKEKIKLRLIPIGGTVITPEDIRLCKEGLGAEDAVQAFGMSEGAPTLSWPRQDELLKRNGGYHKGVGKALPGVRVRICKRGSREVVPRGEKGEVHVGGPAVIGGYLGGEQSEAFYEDAVGNWMVTGDQGVMDEDGVVYVVGRYKDVIIRGGENVSPVKMEMAIGELGVLAQVVAAPDEVAGQVPVAVVKLPEGVGKKVVMHKCRELGPMYALGGVYTLEDLGMDTFPMTSLGKIKKEVLRQEVAKLRAPPPDPAPEPTPEPTPEPAPEVVTNGHGHANSTNGHNNGFTENEANGQRVAPVSPLVEQIMAIWENLIGEKPAPDDNIATYADSITLLRFCDRVQTLLGQRIYLQDFIDHDTIAKQALLIEQRSEESGHTNSISTSKPLNLTQNSTPSFKLNGINGHTNGISQLPATTPTPITSLTYTRPPTTLSPTAQEAAVGASAIAAATAAGFSPSSIEDILRIKDSFHPFASGRRPQSYHNRTVFRVNGTPIPQIRAGLERALATRAVMRTILGVLPDGVPFHVVISPHGGYFDKVISTVEVADEQGLDAIVKDGSDEGHTSPFMARFQIVNVRTTADVYLVATYSHSTYDALSLVAWHLDLNRCVRDPAAVIPALTPYRLWADMYHQFRESLVAQQSVEWNVRRLRGISRFAERALWPPAKTEGWMVAAKDKEGSARQISREKVWEEDGGWEVNREAYTFPRHSRIVTLRGMQKLLREIGMSPSILMKAAIAIFNTLQTKSQYAIFNTWHAGRKWPFVPPWLASTLPPAMSIDGPTTEWIVELIEVIRPGETVSSFLKRVSDEDDDLEQHVQAPWYKILELLGEEAATVMEAATRQAFVWDINLGMTQGFSTVESEKALEVVARHDWPDCGLFWGAFLLGSSDMFFVATWDTAQMRVGEVEGHCETMASVLRKLVKEGNWEKTVADVFA